VAAAAGGDGSGVEGGRHGSAVDDTPRV
jgi:hypothetical protein